MAVQTEIICDQCGNILQDGQGFELLKGSFRIEDIQAAILDRQEFKKHFCSPSCIKENLEEEEEEEDDDAQQE